MRIRNGMTARGVLISSFILTAVTFVAIGFIVSYGTGWHSSSAAGDVNPASNEGTGFVRPLTDTGESPFVAVVEKAHNSVVNITSTRRYRSRYQDMYDEFWLRFFGLRPREYVIPSFGSGFMVDSDGHIVTNNHVVEGGEDITVTLADRSSYKATLVGTDPATDIAVLKIDSDKELSYIGFGSSTDMKIGDWVVAIGNPFPSLGLDRTVTVGVVSGKGRSPLASGSGGPAYQDYIQTDASINPGNSGGPLLNLRGEVIGVNSAIASPSGGSVGIGFAIPSDLAKQIVSEVLSEGKVSRGWLGVHPLDLTLDEAEMVGLDSPDGVYIHDVVSGSPAERGGLKRDDVIIGINGDKITGVRDFQLKIAAADEGEEVSLELLRRGQRKEVKVVLGDMEKGLSDLAAGRYMVGRDEQPDIDESVSSEWLGMTVADCTPELADQFGVDYRDGAIVVAVEPGSPADVKGVVPGTIVFEVNYSPVSGREDFETVANKLKGRTRAIAFHVFDASGHIEYIAIKPK